MDPETEGGQLPGGKFCMPASSLAMLSHTIHLVQVFYCSASNRIICGSSFPLLHVTTACCSTLAIPDDEFIT